MKKTILSSPFTTGTGWTTILLALLDAARALLDGNPNTNPDWGIVIGFIVTGIAQLRTADHKTVEQVATVVNQTAVATGTEIITKETQKEIAKAPDDK